VWIHTGTHWAEVRSSHPGILAGLKGFVTEPPVDEPVEEGVLSLVIDEEGKKIRSLPSIYLGPQLVYAHRDVNRVSAVLGEWSNAVRGSAERSVYTLRACTYGEMKGLYGRDMFAGSPFRRKLQRLGVEFDDSPFVEYAGGGFQSDAIGFIRPDFIILGGDDEDDPEIMTTTGAMLPFVMVTYRLGPVHKDELADLVSTLRTVKAVSASRPQALLDALEAA
jgi:hypothetical protein